MKNRPKSTTWRRRGVKKCLDLRDDLAKADSVATEGTEDTEKWLVASSRLLVVSGCSFLSYSTLRALVLSLCPRCSLWRRIDAATRDAAKWEQDCAKR